MTGDENHDNMGPIKQVWLVVRPDALLEALEQVERGTPAVEVMQYVLDLAHQSAEE